MLRFILALVLLLLALPLLVLRPRARQPQPGPVGTIGGVAIPRPPALPTRKLGVVALLAGLLVLGASTFRVVGATAIAIPVTFGSVGSPLRSGIHLVAPWTDLNQLDLRLDEHTMTRAAAEGEVAGDDSIEVISSDQGRLRVDATVRYAIDPEMAEVVYRRLGTTTEQLQAKAIRPEARSTIREVASQFGAVELVAVRRAEYADTIETEIRARLQPLGILVDAVSLRDVSPSEELQAAADAKLQQEQANQRAELELIEARTRAEILTTEATGEADANEILARSLTPELLQRLQIEAYGEGSVFVIPPGGADVLLQAPTGQATTAGAPSEAPAP